MKHTPEVYNTIFTLDELLLKALKEKDSSGKRRTFRLIHQHLTDYLSKVDAYLATPMPPEEPQRPYLSNQSGDVPWIQRGNFQKRKLQRELSGN